MESVDAIAQKLVSNVEQRTGGLLTLTDEWDELKQDIATALRTERANVAAKFAAFADEKGEPRKVNGTLIYTDEGDILSHGGKLFQVLTHSRKWGSIGLCQVKLVEWDEWDSDEDLKANAPRGYSTQAAAEAAKEKNDA